ncbi:hypothetical protein [Bacillus suaedae]|uniref:Uncharacterized protein n=1 Tax=Halalkalibacter suaedae TaxID=2822140 RepID=A0A940WTK3_9BACI|nr:hypothetical protein [Bacillus suaedae]MBP3950182.1 hypothetical protein [Bacillus suaedae]
MNEPDAGVYERDWQCYEPDQLLYDPNSDIYEPQRVWLDFGQKNGSILTKCHQFKGIFREVAVAESRFSRILERGPLF